MSKTRNPYEFDEATKAFMKSTPTPSNPEPLKVSEKFKLKNIQQKGNEEKAGWHN